MELNGRTGVVPGNYVKPLDSPSLSKQERLFDTLYSLYSALDGEEKAATITNTFYKYFQKDDKVAVSALKEPVRFTNFVFISLIVFSCKNT